MQTRVTRDNIAELIRSGVLRVGAKVMIDGREEVIVGLDPGDDAPIDVGSPDHRRWRHINREIYINVPDDGVAAIREALVAKLRDATPATLIPVAEALGMKVRETITYSLVPRGE